MPPLARGFIRPRPSDHLGRRSMNDDASNLRNAPDAVQVLGMVAGGQRRVRNDWITESGRRLALSLHRRVRVSSYQARALRPGRKRHQSVVRVDLPVGSDRVRRERARVPAIVRAFPACWRRQWLYPGALRFGNSVARLMNGQPRNCGLAICAPMPSSSEVICCDGAPAWRSTILSHHCQNRLFSSSAKAAIRSSFEANVR